MRKLWRGKWALALRVIPWAGGAVLAKFVLHRVGWEVIGLSPLHSALLGATVFLFGFLISGVLSDYKESEKIPADFATSLDSLGDELWLQARGRKLPEAREGLENLVALAGTTIDWLHRRETIDRVHQRMNELTLLYPALESGGTPPQYLGRMRQEQSVLRRSVLRMQVIRETGFVSAGYAIAQIMAGLVIGGFLITRIEPLWEAHFFVGLIAFLFTYMIGLIRDLDDPFDYYPEGSGSDEVALFPIEEARNRLRQRIEAID